MSSCLPSFIQVCISVQPNRCHPLNLCVEVVSSRPHQAAPSPEAPTGTGDKPKGRGRSELVQEVVRLAEEASQQAKEGKKGRGKLSKQEKQYRQSKQPNLYTVLQEIAQLALLDLPACEAMGVGA